ncbi:fimbria/pilus outer membrane usher protein [Alteromonas ponticola]|uniref:Fimbrial biogenesis outer membrane usher protein n=1 Tax=Alteromonas ponticola TaxID=2720613 RepID=A0ABX1R1Z2_9ALTE|nr:fimbria/pilus outer membrane usher protein [Alteromonas ponticola]NMH60467.1 fimbrial biogenesis outer membrane usher protein [Alteromonas ponticola]
MESLVNKQNVNAYFCVVLIFFVYSKSINLAFASEVTLNSTGTDIEFITLLKIGEKIVGEATVIITANNKVLLSKENLSELLSPHLVDRVVVNLLSIGDKQTLSQEDFAKAGLHFQFDQSTFECVITVPDNMKKTYALSLTNRQNEAFHNFHKPEFVSGFINLHLGLSQMDFATEKSSKRFVSGRIDSALNIGKVNIENETSYHELFDGTLQFEREGSRINYDFADFGTRVSIGDLFNPGISFQSGVDILGVGISRDFSLIPTRNIRPKARRSFSLQQNAEVDVIIDGVLLRRLSLEAGNYDLDDIPLSPGSNDISLIIRDHTGLEELIDFSVATGLELLSEGEFEYSFLYGAPSVYENNQLNYLYDDRIAHGYIEYGLSPWLTVGANAQKNENTHQLGGHALFASKLGVFEIAATRSHSKIAGRGSAYRIAFDSEIDHMFSFNPRLNIFYEYFSPNFTELNINDLNIDAASSSSHFVSGTISATIDETLNASLAMSYRHDDSRGNNYWQVSPSLSGQLFSTSATWSLRTNYLNSEFTGSEWNVSFAVSYSLSSASRMKASYNSNNEQYAMDAYYHNNVGYIGGLSGFASLISSAEQSLGLDTGASYYGSSFQASGRYSQRYTSFDSANRVQSTRINIGSSLAFAGNEFVIGRPVREGFAIVTKHANLSENRVSVSPSVEKGYSKAILDTFDTALLSDFLAYSPQLIPYDIDNLPVGYDLGEGAFRINPSYKRGYLFQIGSDAVITVIGQLKAKATGSDLGLVSGLATLQDGDNLAEPQEFFSNSKGVFAISGLKPGVYRLELNTADKLSTIIDLRNAPETLVRLGEIYVE